MRQVYEYHPVIDYRSFPSLKAGWTAMQPRTGPFENVNSKAGREELLHDVSATEVRQQVLDKPRSRLERSAGT
jgi:hypothetical protein